MSKKRIIFIQGHGISSPTEINDWPSWLGQEMEKYGFELVKLAMPDPMYPDIRDWLNFLNNQDIIVDSNTYFVGHSLGCITIARFLEKLPNDCIAGGCVFVSGFCSFPEVPLIQDFCSLPIDFSQVKKHSKSFVFIVSDNDHIIPKKFSEDFASKLDARVIVEHKKGHFITGTKDIISLPKVILEMDLPSYK